MKTNENLQKDIQEAIVWEPLLKASMIDVSVSDGIVTLSGTVDSFARKEKAEEAVKNVDGVKVVVGERLEVQSGHVYKRINDEIAAEVLNVFKWNWEIPHEKLQVKVEDGRVYLEGTVKWNYQREAAVKAVRSLIGVRGVINAILIKSDTDDKIERTHIELALLRNSYTHKNKIDVNVSENKVTLSGTVGSWFQKEEAARMAWKAPGVQAVENAIHVE